VRGSSLVVAAVTAACMPTYNFERAPLPSASPSEAARCYEAKRLALVRGDGTWRKQYRAGDYIITETWGKSGIAFYRGDRQLTTLEALDTLPDRQLADGYRNDVARTEHDYIWYPRYRNGAFAMAGAGLVLALVGLGIEASSPGNNSDLVFGLAGAGAGLALLSIIPTILASKTYDGAVLHDIAKTMFTRSEWGARLVEGARAADQRAADDCRSAPAELSISPGARTLLGLP
jgi:hypothetical protein